MEPPSNGYSNTPPGYPQQPQQPGYQQQYAQPGYGGPGMAPPPYPQYAPQKKGMPWWGWLLIIGGVGFVGLLFLGIMAVAAVPALSANTRDARRAEGEAMLQHACNMARVAYARSGTAPTQLAGSFEYGGCGMNASELVGQYYTVQNAIGSGPFNSPQLQAHPNVTSDGVGVLNFTWREGPEPVVWR